MPVSNCSLTGRGGLRDFFRPFWLFFRRLAGAADIREFVQKIEPERGAERNGASGEQPAEHAGEPELRGVCRPGAAVGDVAPADG